MALQKPLRGLADLLGFYRLGKAPLDYTGLVSLGLPAEQFLSEPESARVSGTVNAAFDFVGVTVPDDEVWLAWAISTYTTGPIGAGDIFLAVPNIVWADSNSSKFYFTDQPTNRTFGGTNVNDVFCKGRQFERGFWIPSGAQCRSDVVIKNNANNVTLFLDIMYSKFRV